MEPNGVEAIENLIASGGDEGAWSAGLAIFLRRDQVPHYLSDPALHAYLRKLAADAPGLRAMYEARMF